MLSIEQKTCASCKATFNCGAARVEVESCWCESVSGTLASPNAQLDCFCPECLPLIINNQDWAEQLRQTDSDSTSQPERELAEGEDYLHRG